MIEGARAAGAARPDATGDDVPALVRALARVAPPGGSTALDRAVGIVLDGLAVPR
ncbi:hypothetical protein [Streptomyces spectabilis]|uniref:SbtR family transcriptional regulator n=1 Tax=Streptomyces spectabilis TaxID=68270 RepID=UPI00137721C5|nr:hypothetical protein [Streptomyces spectabilis]